MLWATMSKRRSGALRRVLILRVARLAVKDRVHHPAPHRLLGVPVHHFAADEAVDDDDRVAWHGGGVLVDARHVVAPEGEAPGQEDGQTRRHESGGEPWTRAPQERSRLHDAPHGAAGTGHRQYRLPRATRPLS